MSTVRITGGIYKGRVIQVSKGNLAIRPAMDIMRESFFSILGNLEGRSFLDLFAGSGIIGLEAASREAESVCCVERDRAKFPQLLENVAIAERKISCHCLPVERFIMRAKATWSVIFCDPPFPYQFKPELVQKIAQYGLLTPNGVLLLHCPSREVLADRYLDLSLVDERKYGGSTLKFYAHSTSNDLANSVNN